MLFFKYKVKLRTCVYAQLRTRVYAQLQAHRSVPYLTLAYHMDLKQYPSIL